MFMGKFLDGLFLTSPIRTFFARLFAAGKPLYEEMPTA